MPQKSTLSFNKIRCYQPPRRELFLFSHAYDLQVPSVATPSRELFSYPNRQPNLTCELTSHGVAQRAVPCVGRLLTTYGTLIPTHISGLPILYLVFPPSFPSFLPFSSLLLSFLSAQISLCCPDPRLLFPYLRALPGSHRLAAFCCGSPTPQPHSRPPSPAASQRRQRAPAHRTRLKPTPRRQRMRGGVSVATAPRHARARPLLRRRGVPAE